jgi:2-methylcitrate dehydratase PrpD
MSNADNHATQRLAQHAAALGYDALPAALVTMLKQCVLDTLGVTIGASGLAPEAKILADYVTEAGGKAESTLLGFGTRATAAQAALVNGSLGHMLDYDDVGAGGHVSIVTIPVALALAEKCSAAARPVSGGDLLAAIAAGTDIHTRLNQAIQIPDWTIAEGWFPTQMFGFISGAAAAARVLGLDAAQTENALGIGFNQMSGSRQMAVGAATHMRSMQAGFSSQGAVLAAELAARGIVGSKQVIEGRYGLFRTYVRDSAPDWPALLGGLGKDFPLLAKHGFKVWPACGYTRATNTAVLELRNEYKIKPAEVEAITVIGGTGGAQLLSEPIEAKRRPQLSIDGKFSIPFTTAIMMTHGNVQLRDYTDAALRDPAVLAMADRVSWRADPSAAVPVGGESALSRPTVEIRLIDGRTLSRKADGVPGDPRHPIAQDQLEAKFRDCMAFAAKPVSAQNVERAITLIADLENLEDAAAIVRVLA